ncbi:MAG: Ig-like domain-containing protein [Gemmatimonadales bacterium]|nr:Ig-like domain-containing protein [Gemmatimonadales bacterium]
MSDRLVLPFLIALPLAIAACGGDTLTLPDEGEAANIEVMDGNGQRGRVGSVLPESLVVQVTDTRDRAVAGAEVVFDFADQGSASPATTLTDANGRAAALLMLGTTVGEVAGAVHVPVPAGRRPVETTFTATALSDEADKITLTSGNNQTGTVNSLLAAPLVVQVTDEFGNPIQGVAVEWAAVGGGEVSQTSTFTGANGQASVTRTLGNTAGEQSTLATAGNLAGSPVTFIHTATAGSATGVLKVSGDNQSGSPGTELRQPLVVQVLDASGNPIPNRAVTWVIGSGGGSVAPENTTTDPQGNASTQWTLGPAVGANTVNAVVSGVGTATFSANATAGEPSGANSEVTASPSTITAGSGSSTITVTIRDAGNNPVAGVSVTVSSSGSGNTISPSSASSGSNGVATFTFSSTAAEAKVITATAGGAAIDDQATITVQKATSIIEITSDDPDPSVAGQEVTVEFNVRGGGVSPTGNVTVTVSEGPESCSSALSNGSGSCILTLLTPGLQPNRRRILTATYSGDDRFLGDTDSENHVVNAVPVANNPPTAAFEAPSCTVGQPCQFTDGSSDGDGTIQRRLWEFQDGTPATSSDPNPSVTFSSEGSKTVTLTVTDDDGATDVETKQVTVAPAPNQPPTAAFDPPTNCVAGQPCEFFGESSDSDGSSLTRVWEFQDGNPPTSTEVRPSVTFSSAGPKQVTLTVTDDDGATDAVTHTVEVAP